MLTREVKDSGVEWIGEIPKDWEMKKVKSLLVERSEKNHPNEEILSLYRDYGVIPKNSRDDNHNVTSLNTESYKLVLKDNVVINKMKAWQGSLAVSKYQGIISPAYYIYEIKSTKEILPEFLHYALRNPVYIQEYRRISAGLRIGQWDLNKIEFNGLYYPIPPIEVQSKIVDFLDEKIRSIDELVQNNQQSIEEFKKYKQSIITEAVTKGLNSNAEMESVERNEIKFHPKHWTLSKIKYHVQIDPSKQEHFSELPTEATFLPMNKLKNGFIINTEKDKTEILENKYTYFAEGDIVIAKVRPSFENGNIAIAKNLLNKIGFGTSEIFVLRNKQKKIIQEFLLYFLRNDIFIQYGSSSMTGVAGLQRISTNFIMNYPIAIPPIEEQLEIVNYLNYKVEQIDELILKKEKTIEELKKYKKSLIYEYVTGKKEV